MRLAIEKDVKVGKTLVAQGCRPKNQRRPTGSGLSLVLATMILTFTDTEPKFIDNESMLMQIDVQVLLMAVSSNLKVTICFVVVVDLYEFQLSSYNY